MPILGKHVIVIDLEIVIRPVESSPPRAGRPARATGPAGAIPRVRRATSIIRLTVLVAIQLPVSRRGRRPRGKRAWLNVTNGLVVAQLGVLTGVFAMDLREKQARAHVLRPVRPNHPHRCRGCCGSVSPGSTTPSRSRSSKRSGSPSPSASGRCQTVSLGEWGSLSPGSTTPLPFQSSVRSGSPVPIRIGRIEDRVGYHRE